MVREIMKDVEFLSQVSKPATKEDLPIAIDLLDTLKSYEGRCVGMAANMIGVQKCIIVVKMETGNVAMINPVILKKSGEYEAEEGCLSLEGRRKCLRYDEIEVEYEDMEFVKHTETFQGYVAEIIQHEVDHLFGIII